MRATSRFRPLVYVIEPQRRQFNSFGQSIGDTRPLRVEFRGHREGFFDSELIRDPQERERVEEFLRNHPDNGKRYHIEKEGPKAQKKAKGKTCLATVHVKGQPASVCGKPVVEGLDYCEECAESETAAV